MDTLNELATLLRAMRDDPNNFEKATHYFEALADARLTDYYNMADENRKLRSLCKRVAQWLSSPQKLTLTNPLIDELNAASHFPDKKLR